MSSPTLPQNPSQTSAAASFERHPRGIQTLFFTEMWERMSYYGMRALLILFMTAGTAKGGMGLPDKTAAAIYGLYVCGVYLVALPGGWLADRLLGAQRAVLIGGIIIALGHFTLAIPGTQAFFIGLLLVVLGTALLKPCASAIVGALYPEGGARRDAGFTLFYMGVNLGAFIGPIVCGYLGERVNWHYGFAASGFGMVLGVVQYALMSKNLGDAGKRPSHPSPTPGRHWRMVAGILGTLLLFAALCLAGVITLDPVAMAHSTSVLIASVAVAWFLWAFFFAGLDSVEKKRLGMVAVLFVVSAVFWSGFEQAGSSMNLFGERYTDRHVLGWNVPAGWFLSINAVFVLAFAPVFSWLWLALARRGWSPSLGAKFAWGLLMLALGFVVMHFGSKLALANGSVGPGWLTVTFLLHTWGELALSPVGLSAVTKLAPARLATQTMGIWFLSISMGNLLAGLMAGFMSPENVAAMPTLFLNVAIIAGSTALVLALAARPLKRLAAGVE